MKNNDTNTDNYPSLFSSIIWFNLLLLMILSIVMSGCNQGVVSESQDIVGETEVADLEGAETDIADTRLEVRSAENLGEYLTDDNGRSLYIFLADSPLTSTCYGHCADDWPPFTTQGTPTAEEEVDVSKIGTIQRNDGTTQVTYAGWPLYYYVKDQGAGQRTGQDIKDHGAEWYLISPEGNKVEGEGH